MKNDSQEHSGFISINLSPNQSQIDPNNKEETKEPSEEEVTEFSALFSQSTLVEEQSSISLRKKKRVDVHKVISVKKT